MLYSAMLMHGYFPQVTARCTIIPIPKGKNVNVTVSQNYRGISMCSVFAKLYDLIFLEKFSELLVTSDLQFGFKRHHSTTMCSMVLKETLAYYTVDNGAAFCTFLDATKAFDRVDFCKLFRELLKRKIPTIHLRLLLNMYTNSTARINWNGAFGQSFGIRNGVKQGGIISPVLFCIYIDGLLVRLKHSKIGCWIGNTFVGALAMLMTLHCWLRPHLKKGKVFPYSLPSVGPGADPGVQAVSPQVT